MSLGSEFDTVLAAAQQGEEWAFSALYRDVNPALLRYLYAQVAGHAEDLAGDTWLAVARQVPTFSGPEAAFRGWLFTIARRRVIQHWREGGRRPSSPVPPEALADLAAPDDLEEQGLRALSAQETAALISQALPPAQADVVLLRVVAGLDVPQVADILGKRPGTVRVLQHKAIRRLAEVFSPERVTL